MPQAGTRWLDKDGDKVEVYSGIPWLDEDGETWRVDISGKEAEVVGAPIAELTSIPPKPETASGEVVGNVVVSAVGIDARMDRAVASGTYDIIKRTDR